MKVGLVSLVDHYPGKGLSQAERFAQVVDQAVRADELGFDTFWVGEHHFTDFISSNPVPILAAIAARTSRIRIGTGVALPAHRHPIRVAEDYAAVDVLSNGRLDLVVSRGVFRNAFDGFRQDFAERGDRLQEAIDVIRGCWTSEDFSYEGPFTQFSNLCVQPRPVQTPHPPLWIGCGSVDSARAAADAGLNLALFDFPGLGDPRPIVRAYRDRVAELGADPAAHKVSLGRHAYIRATEEQARREFEPHYRTYFTMPVPGVRRPDTGLDAPAIKASELPVERLFTNCLCTDPERAIAYLRSMRDDVGLDHYWLKVDMGAQPTSQVLESLEVIARDVIPAVRN